jgi:biotin transport system substrate-specific component
LRLETIDWRAFFAGEWRMARRIDDRRGGRIGEAGGVASFRSGDDARSLACAEALTIDYGGRRIEGESRTIWRFVDSGGPDLYFPDWRFFCAVRFQRNGYVWRAEFMHNCGEDRYEGFAEVGRRDDWRLVWNVFGPRKNYALDTLYSRIVDGRKSDASCAGLKPEAVCAAIFARTNDMRAQSNSAAVNSVLAERMIASADGAARLLKRAALVAIGVAALALAAKIRIPLWPVPVTMQTFAVLAIGTAYGTRLGVATVVTWLFLGATGAGVFANSSAVGLSYMLGDTGGYLFGFALAAAMLGPLARRGWDRSPAKTAAMMAIGNAVIYAPGLLWLGLRHGFDAPILEWGLYPFLIGDAAKLALAVAVFPLAWRAVNAARR